MNVDALFELTSEEKVARIDAALERARQALDEATARYESETAGVREQIQALVARREEIAPVAVEVVEAVEEVSAEA